MITSRVPLLPFNKTVLAVTDCACVAAALLFSVTLRLGWSAGLQYVAGRSPGLFAVSIFFPLSFYVCGLYDTQRLRNPARAVVPAAVSVSLALLLGGAFWFGTSLPGVGRGIVLQFVPTLLAAIMTARLVYARARGMLNSRCLIVGSHEQAAKVMALIRKHPDASLKIAGLVLCVDGRHRDESHPAERLSIGYPVLGTLESLEELVATHRIDRLILATNLDEEPALLRRLRPLRYRGVGFVDLVSLYEELAGEVPLDHIDDEWLFRAATMSSQLHIRRVKRVTDVVVSLLLLIPTMLVLPLAALAIKLTSKGSVLFRQERVGLGSKPFMLLKLRTMYQDAEKHTGPVWSTDNDPRITPVGRVLRKFRIDELPQLINVLLGDMSLVGPRPERPVFVEKLSEAVPFYSERLLVRPGITGWAQVMAPYAASIGDSLRKLQFDLYYTKNLSFSLDLLIFLKTAKTILFGRERVQGGMTAGQQLETMPEPTRLDVARGGALVAGLQPKTVAEAVVFSGDRTEPGKIAQA